MIEYCGAHFNPTEGMKVTMYYCFNLAGNSLQGAMKTFFEGMFKKLVQDISNPITQLDPLLPCHYCTLSMFILMTTDISGFTLILVGCKN